MDIRDLADKLGEITSTDRAEEWFEENFVSIPFEVLVHFATQQADLVVKKVASMDELDAVEGPDDLTPELNAKMLSPIVALFMTGITFGVIATKERYESAAFAEQMKKATSA